MKFGYARVSTPDQQTAAQISVLRTAGCERIFEEKASGGAGRRPELDRLLDYLRPGDTVYVWKLDRLGRSVRDLIWIIDEISAAGAGFVSLTESMDTSTPAGRMLPQIIGAVAEFEREMIRERTGVAVQAARRRGVRMGRPPKLDPTQREIVAKMVRNDGYSFAEVGRLLKVHPSTIARIISTFDLISDEERRSRMLPPPGNSVTEVYAATIQPPKVNVVS